MLIRKYGVTIRTLKEKDVELLRVNRNKKSISSRMFFTEEITPEMQKDWWNNVRNPKPGDEIALYFIVNYEGKDIGYMHGKNLDLINRTSEGGIAIWEESYWKTPLPVMCAIIMLDYSLLIHNFHKNFIRVRTDNTPALEFNLSLGYTIVSKNDTEVFLELTRERYEQLSAKVRTQLGTLTGDHTILNASNVDLSDDSDAEILEQYRDMRDDQKAFIDSVLKLQNRTISG